MLLCMAFRTFGRMTIGRMALEWLMEKSFGELFTEFLHNGCTLYLKQCLHISISS